jgi:hypothetical protein
VVQFADMQSGTPLPWDEPSWFERVEAWVGAELSRVGLKPQGKLELLRTRPWAAVARVATASGDVWFKEAAPALAFEPGLTVAVSRPCPDFTPEVLAVEGTWMLTRDAGPMLRSFRKSGEPAPSWDEILPRYAELQIQLADDLNELLALGAPDKRPAAVSSAYPDLVERIDGAEPWVRERLRTLAPKLELLVEALQGPLRLTVIHEEAHESNLFVRGGHVRLLDWAEASISHPFAGLVNTLRDIAYRRRLKPNGREMLRLRSVYLEPWTRFAPAAELHELFDRGYLLGTVCRAMTWERILAHQPAPVRAEYGRNATVWLDIFREGIEEGVRLGV